MEDNGDPYAQLSNGMGHTHKCYVFWPLCTAVEGWLRLIRKLFDWPCHLIVALLQETVSRYVAVRPVFGESTL